LQILELSYIISFLTFAAALLYNVYEFRRLSKELREGFRRMAEDHKAMIEDHKMMIEVLKEIRDSLRRR
jgi:large-conductance mechanosensitive channel